MYATQNMDLLTEELAREINTADRLNAQTEPLSAGQRDALRAAEIHTRAYTEQILDMALYSGVDFIEIPCAAYTLCYALEAGRWEGFVSFNGQTIPLAS